VARASVQIGGGERTAWKDEEKEKEKKKEKESRSAANRAYISVVRADSLSRTLCRHARVYTSTEAHRSSVSSGRRETWSEE